MESRVSPLLKPYLSLFIFVGKTYCMDPYALNDMIREINRTQVLEEEWLSNHTYLYQRAEQKLISVLN